MYTEFMNTLQAARIMVVDDEAANLRLLNQMLTMAGYENITTIADPREVAEYFKQQSFDLLLLDLNMPWIDGYTLMEQLKQQQGEQLPPILVLTAQRSQEFRQRALDGGARDYISKPFDVNELLSRVRNLLEVHQAHLIVRNQNQLLENKVRERTQKLEEAHAELRESQLQIVRRLGRAAEYRDNETGLHIIRMSKMAALLAQAAGMDARECELLLNAAPMHDIGKIGIPDAVLLKPGKFNPEEWKIMQSHALIGADILSDDSSELLKMAYSIALSHHEKWDGSGYPQGLAGEDIPLVGRITALADVFDALTSSRPYKKAWTTEAAVELITEQKAQHFDPALVEIFLSLLPEIDTIRKQHAEPEISQ